eukprot:2079430-Rhodomonas_salina.3
MAMQVLCAVVGRLTCEGLGCAAQPGGDRDLPAGVRVGADGHRREAYAQQLLGLDLASYARGPSPTDHSRTPTKHTLEPPNSNHPHTLARADSSRLSLPIHTIAPAHLLQTMVMTGAMAKKKKTAGDGAFGAGSRC